MTSTEEANSLFFDLLCRYLPAGDAARIIVEGFHWDLARCLVIDVAGCVKSVQRLTAGGIKKGLAEVIFQDLHPSSGQRVGVPPTPPSKEASACGDTSPVEMKW